MKDAPAKHGGFIVTMIFALMKHCAAIAPDKFVTLALVLMNYQPLQFHQKKLECDAWSARHETYSLKPEQEAISGTSV